MVAFSITRPVRANVAALNSRKAVQPPHSSCVGFGYIDDVDPEAGELTASFDGRAVTYGFGELDTPVPAYAATIHKSQGSEYPAVVIPVLTQH
jgi:hypothetical protein